MLKERRLGEVNTHRANQNQKNQNGITYLARENMYDNTQISWRKWIEKTCTITHKSDTKQQNFIKIRNILFNYWNNFLWTIINFFRFIKLIKWEYKLKKFPTDSRPLLYKIQKAKFKNSHWPYYSWCQLYSLQKSVMVGTSANN